MTFTAKKIEVLSTENNTKKIIVSKNIGTLIKKEGIYGLFEFEFGKYVFNLHKVKWK